MTNHAARAAEIIPDVCACFMRDIYCPTSDVKPREKVKCGACRLRARIAAALADVERETIERTAKKLHAVADGMRECDRKRTWRDAAETVRNLKP